MQVQHMPNECTTGPRSAIASASDSRAKCSWLDTRSGHISSFLLPLDQEGYLSVTCERTCKLVPVNRLGGQSLPRGMVWLARHNHTVYHGRTATKQQQLNASCS